MCSLSRVLRPARAQLASVAFILTGSTHLVRAASVDARRLRGSFDRCEGLGSIERAPPSPPGFVPTGPGGGLSEFS